MASCLMKQLVEPMIAKTHVYQNTSGNCCCRVLTARSGAPDVIVDNQVSAPLTARGGAPDVIDDIPAKSGYLLMVMNVMEIVCWSKVKCT